MVSAERKLSSCIGFAVRWAKRFKLSSDVGFHLQAALHSLTTDLTQEDSVRSSDSGNEDQRVTILLAESLLFEPGCTGHDCGATVSSSTVRRR